jgi:hypothetical protein
MKFVLFVLCTLEVQSTKSTMGLTPTPQNEILTFAISCCKTFWGAPTSSVTIAHNLNKRLFYYTTNLCKWQQYTKIILDTYLLTLTNVNRNPEEEEISMSFQEQSATKNLLTRTNVNRNQKETKTHARTCRRKLRMIDQTWCRRVGDEYDSTMRTKTAIDTTGTMGTTTAWQKQNDNWQRYRRRCDDENKRPSWQKQKDDLSKPYKLSIERVEGNYLMTINQATATIAPTKMTKAQRVDEGNDSKQKRR